MRHLNQAALLLILLLATLTTDVNATVLVAPSSDASTEGNTNSYSPFNAFSNESVRYQQVFNATEFSSLGSAEYITQLIFRPDGVLGNAFSGKASGYKIYLSTTSASADNLSSTFSNNIGSDNTLVFNGILLLSSSFTGPAGGPKDFDIVLNLQTPFLYNPSAGNLLLDVSKPENAFSGQSTGSLDASSATDDSTSSVIYESFNSLDNATTATSGAKTSTGLITEFTFSSVPEPSAVVLSLFSVGGCFLFRGSRFRRNKIS